MLYGDGDRPTSTSCSSAALRMALAAAAERPDGAAPAGPAPGDRPRLVPARPACRATSATSTGSAARSPQLPGRLDYLAELGTTYLHLMPLLQPRPGENDGGYAVHGLPRGRPAAGHDGRPRGRRRRAARAGHEPLHRPRAQPHRAGAPLGAGLAGGRSGVRRLLHRVPRPDDARRLRRDHPGGLPRPGARLVQLGARGLRRCRRLGVDDVLALPVGPRLHEPRGHAGDARRDHLAGQPRASTCSGWTPSRSCGSGWAPPARTSRRATGCCSCCTR